MHGRGGRRQGAGRKATWQTGETQTIRVPVALKDELLDIGKHLDRGDEIYDGRTCTELRQLVRRWEMKCEGNEGEEWQLVRQLLDEIKDVLDSRPGGKGRHRNGFGRGNCRRGGELESGRMRSQVIEESMSATETQHCSD